MKLSDLDFAVEDVQDAIENAQYCVECLVEEYDGQWQELNDLLTRITVAKTEWKKIIPPEVKETIQGECEYNADMEDFHRVTPY